MGSTDFSRRKDACFDRVAQAAKVFEHFGGSQGEMSFDVLEEAPFWLDLSDDPHDVWPKVPWVSRAETFASERERLTWVSSSEEMNSATQRAAVEGSDIVPDRSVIQGFVRHPSHEGGRRECFPLDETDSAVSGFCDVETELQSANAGTESDPSEGLAGFRFGT
nr:hypothetical protein [Aureimonas sp. N4]